MCGKVRPFSGVCVCVCVCVHACLAQMLYGEGGRVAVDLVVVEVECDTVCVCSFCGLAAIASLSLCFLYFLCEILVVVSSSSVAR